MYRMNLELPYVAPVRQHNVAMLNVGIGVCIDEVEPWCVCQL